MINKNVPLQDIFSDVMKASSLIWLETKKYSEHFQASICISAAQN